MSHIPFNKPHITGKEIQYLNDLFSKQSKFSGNGEYTKKCHDLIKTTYDFRHCLLTSSCTDALEMSSILCNINEGDEVILPSFTFVSTANAFLLRGAKLRFVDSMDNHPNISVEAIEAAITDRTKVICVVHYAGVGCDMDAILKLCRERNIYCVEDAAQAIGAKLKNQYLGSFGDLSTFSFHETKNIISGEGGCLIVNNPDMIERSEFIWEKGTNRSAFSRGEVNKYNWVDIGSSFLPSELTAAFLLAQLEERESILGRRLERWKQYKNILESETWAHEFVELPTNPSSTEHNGHLFYLVLKDGFDRNQLLRKLNDEDVNAVFHYLPLHSSPYFKNSYKGPALTNCDRFASQLFRLPLYADMTSEQVDYCCDKLFSIMKSF